MTRHAALRITPIPASVPAPGTVPAEHGRRRRPPTSSAAIRDFFDRQHTSSDALPDPEPLVLNLTRCVIEILAGARDLEQIGRWIDADLHARLLRRVVIAARARQATGRAPVRPAMSLGAARIESPSDGVVEAAVVVHLPARSRAVTMRLVGVDGRWRAVQLAVL